MNENGLVPFGSNSYSYYYSLTRMKVTGFLKIDGIRLPVIGIGWIDHQYGDFFHKEQGETYEWFCIQLDINVDIICGYSYPKNLEVVNPFMTYMFADNCVKNGKIFL